MPQGEATSMERENAVEVETRRILRAARLLSVSAWVVNLALLGLIAYLTTVIRGDFEKLLLELNATLPALSAALLALSPGLCLAAVCILAGLLTLMEIVFAAPAVRLSAHIIMAMMLLIFITLYYLALLLPIIGAMRVVQ